jgi:hypothetical protein
MRPIWKDWEEPAMEMLYQSDSFVVVRFELPADAEAGQSQRGGYEIVDKFARKEIFLQGALADRFRRGAAELSLQGPASPEVLDDYIAQFAASAQNPLVLH